MNPFAPKYGHPQLRNLNDYFYYKGLDKVSGVVVDVGSKVGKTFETLKNLR